MKQIPMTDSEIQSVLVSFWKWGNQLTPSGNLIKELYEKHEWKTMKEGWILGACKKDLTCAESIMLLSYVNDNF